jgi:hypothetical protein
MHKKVPPSVPLPGGSTSSPQAHRREHLTDRQGRRPAHLHLRTPVPSTLRDEGPRVAAPAVTAQGPGHSPRARPPVTLVTDSTGKNEAVKATKTTAADGPAIQRRQKRQRPEPCMPGLDTGPPDALPSRAKRPGSRSGRLRAERSQHESRATYGPLPFLLLNMPNLPRKKLRRLRSGTCIPRPEPIAPDLRSRWQSRRRRIARPRQ